MRAIDEVRAFIEEHQVRMVDLRFCDLLGTCHHLTLPVSALNGETFECGVGFDASSVAGFKTPSKAATWCSSPSPRALDSTPSVNTRRCP